VIFYILLITAMKHIIYLTSILFSFCFELRSASQSDSLLYQKLLKDCAAVCDDSANFSNKITALQSLAIKINQPYSLGKLDFLKGRYHALHGRYDSSSHFFNSAFLKLKVDPTLNSNAAKCLAGIANNWMNIGDNTKALNTLLSYLEYSKENKLHKQEADAYSRLGNLFDLESKPQLAIQYLKKGELVAKQHAYNEELADIYNMIATAYYSQYANDTNYTKKSLLLLDSSLYYFQTGIQLCESINDSIDLGRIYNNMMGAYEYKKDYIKALECIKKSIAINKQVSEERALAEPYANLASAYFNLKDYGNAKASLDTAILIAKKYQIEEALLTCYDLGIQFSYQEKNYFNAFEFLIAKTTLNDSIYGISTSNKMSELEIQYQTKEKAATINLQKEQLKRRNYTIIFVSFILLLTVLATVLLIRNSRAKSNLEIEQQKQRAAIMVVESEQKERMRIARELHDGIGQKLTVLKLYASAEPEKNSKQLQLLDNTIQEVREISHKMIPEILSLGLMSALKDLCYKINDGGMIQCQFTCEEAVKTIQLAPDIELSIYRIVQEVLNNMLKHAEANVIQVVLKSNDQKLHIHISDNGKGFDVNKIKQSSGIGWSNIFTRARIINAEIDVNSNHQGTQIDLNLHI
jgi:two-component system, NarL family, sensor kinase